MPFHLDSVQDQTKVQAQLFGNELGPCPLVDMADMEMAESAVTTLAREMMRRPCRIPA